MHDATRQQHTIRSHVAHFVQMSLSSRTCFAHRQFARELQENVESETAKAVCSLLRLCCDRVNILPCCAMLYVVFCVRDVLCTSLARCAQKRFANAHGQHVRTCPRRAVPRRPLSMPIRIPVGTATEADALYGSDAGLRRMHSMRDAFHLDWVEQCDANPTTVCDRRVHSTRFLDFSNSSCTRFHTLSALQFHARV